MCIYQIQPKCVFPAKPSLPNAGGTVMVTACTHVYSPFYPVQLLSGLSLVWTLQGGEHDTLTVEVTNNTKCNLFIYIFQLYDDVIMGTMASQITRLTIVYTTVYSGADQRKHQSSASLAFVRGIHRWPVNSPHKWPVTRKMFPFDDVIMRAVLLPDTGVVVHVPVVCKSLQIWAACMIH